MDKESIQKKLYDELDRLGKELNLPEAEINRMKLQYVDIAELTEDPDMLTRLSDDLISSLLYRANQGIPDNVPDELIVENIVQQETANKTFEVSTKGDDLGKQFSALNATFKEGPYKGRTIEDVWQNEIKKSGKGRPPAEDSILFGKDYQVSKDEYQKLWQRWADENPELINQLQAKVDEGYNLVDSFAGDPNKTVNQAEALTNILNNKKGGSVGAAKRNDPLFPEKIEEYDPQIHGDFKEKILDKLNEQEQKLLNYYNNHDVVKASGLNGESVLLGIVKAFGYDVFEKYNSLSNWNPVKWSGFLSKFLFKGMIAVLDPIGEGIETAVKIGKKTGAIKDGVKLAKLGGVASNWRYELLNQAIWQGTASMVGIVDNAADALNSVLDEYGLLPEFVKERIDVVPYEDLNKHLAHQSRYWQSAGWQGSKLTSLWYNLDTMLPSRLTGNTPHNWAIQKYGVMPMLPARFELEADEQDYWDIITGQREFKQNAQDGFFGWWKNENEQTGQGQQQPSYFAQVNNPDLNVYNANSHVDTWNKLNQIKDRFGPGIMDMAGYDISMYNTWTTGDE